MTLVTRFEKWLAANYPKALASFAPSVGAAQFEAALGSVRTASSLLALYEWRNGQPPLIAPPHGKYYFPAIDSLFKTKQMLDGMARAGEWDDEETKWKSWWVVGWVPFFDNCSGDLLVIDTVGSFGGEVGQVIEFFHDWDLRKIVAPSFDAWFESWVASLEADQWSVNADGRTSPANDNALKGFLARQMPGYPKRFQAEKEPR